MSLEGKGSSSAAAEPRVSKAFAIERAASGFLVTAICEFGDPAEVRIAAVQTFLDVAGFDARATCYPVFGAIWRTPCEGPDADAATDWLESVTENLRRGEANDEVRQLRVVLEARALATGDSVAAEEVALPSPGEQSEEARG